MPYETTFNPRNVPRRLSNLFLCLLVGVGSPALAADSPVLERYVQAGLESNLTLRQQGIEVSRALAVDR